ncbi:phosphoenolpyruvate--protein phosphotransferase [Parendozoicomonas haliclonae]|uniref:phosphoenolpyruvate--protein phosphotransferase n=1 Tax=Parendozoicomonas haliclonae TaxID=1960125 RepID=A0A1X7AFL8_9GAMM|nr:phosphoenolpyruvate--protein phosphotransferase [Parendozoicomonas haliclonae]SMA37976.1 Phosphoenolpyruvate-protein phosphotransferase [Parendozoicomonas haliclonae]
MLSTLRRIVQEVGAARDLQTALDVIVRSVSVAMCSDVCSVYLYNEDTNRYTLMASEGLNRQAVGRVTLGRSEGLVGQVGLREEPINLEDAASHPKFRYLKETGEERYRSFLGAPIIHHRRLLGVLVIQQTKQRRFDESEESFLVTMSAQLAGVIAHAEATGSLHFPTSAHERPRQSRFIGVAGAPGIAIGTAVVLAPPADINAVPEKDTDDIELELTLFRQALVSVREMMSATAEKLSGQIPAEEQALFDVYLRMLDDNALGAEIEALIRKGQWAQGALKAVILEHVRHFEMMDDPYLRERATDVRDLGRRVLAALQQQQQDDVAWPDNAIVISEELTPSVLGEVPREKLAGLVSVQGSGNSHVAILARAMGAPTVMGAVDLPWDRMANRELIVDGNLGRVYVSPAPELINQYRSLIDEELAFVEGLESLKDEPCITPDHYRLPLWVNTGLMTDAIRSLDHGAEGVGLYRTEVPFMIRERFPSEKEQEDIYREQLKSFAPRPVTIRTLDIGGDKSLGYFPIKEENPFLGWRGIRVTLDHPEIFLVQIRAMLKASEGLDNLRIMLPMISGVPEVEEALYLIHRAYHEVLSEGVNIQLPPVGVMIEVPAAVYQVREFARRVDFLSIGSNDLTQYILAVDRNNPRVADLYQPYHPAVLHALHKVVTDAHLEGKPVSICGEMAGDPSAAVLLMAMGFDVLSMNATNLPRVKWALRNIPLTDAKVLLDEVLEMDNPRVIRSAMELALRRRGLDKVLGGRSEIN